MKKLIIKSIILVLILATTDCGYNTLVSLDEESKSSWSEVLNRFNINAEVI